jgi:hypothetical protein
VVGERRRRDARAVVFELDLHRRARSRHRPSRCCWCGRGRHTRDSRCWTLGGGDVLVERPPVDVSQ